jgi:hypothetical protein
MGEPLRIWTIYRNPTDYPTKYVVRGASVTRTIVHDPEPTAVVDSLSEARAAVPSGLVCMPRQIADDPVIVECWL